MSRNDRETGAWGCLPIVLMVIAVIVIGAFANQHRVQHEGCFVEEKDRAATSSSGSSMRVYTDCGIFEVGDSLWLGRWDSADVYQRIEVGETYDFETTGWRIPIISRFPNIVSADAVQR